MLFCLPSKDGRNRCVVKENEAKLLRPQQTVKLSRAIACVALIASLSSCATLLAGYTDEVRVYGSDVPLTFRDKDADTVIPSTYEITDAGLVNSVELDKRADMYNLEIQHPVKTTTLYLVPSLNYNWLIPNYLNWELGFLVDYHTRAAYRFGDQHLYFERTPGGLRIERPVYDSVMGVISASLGMAFPVFYPPQMFNSASVSFGLKLWKRFVVGFDVSAAATSDGVDPQDIVNMNSTLIGPLISFFPSDGFFLNLQPAYHRITYYRNGIDDDPNVFLGSRNHLKVAFGLGARSGGFMVDLRIIPTNGTQLLTNGRRVHSGLVQIRLGYNDDILLYRKER